MCIKRVLSTLCGHTIETPLNCGVEGCKEEQVWTSSTHCDNCYSWLKPYEFHGRASHAERARFASVAAKLADRDRNQLFFGFAGDIGKANPGSAGWQEIDEAARTRRHLELIDIARAEKALETSGANAYFDAYRRLPAVGDEMRKLEEELKKEETQRLREKWEALKAQREEAAKEFEEAFVKQTTERKKVLSRLLRMSEDDPKVDRYLPWAYPGEYPSDYGRDPVEDKARAAISAGAKAAADFAIKWQSERRNERDHARIVARTHVKRGLKRSPDELEKDDGGPRFPKRFRVDENYEAPKPFNGPLDPTIRPEAFGFTREEVAKWDTADVNKVRVADAANNADAPKRRIPLYILARQPKPKPKRIVGGWRNAYAVEPDPIVERMRAKTFEFKLKQARRQAREQGSSPQNLRARATQKKKTKTDKPEANESGLPGDLRPLLRPGSQDLRG